MEIITGVGRRRRWRDEEKLRILAELGEPGAKFNAVARRHDLSRGLLWQWRDAQRRGKLVAEEPAFVPLRVAPELPAPELPAPEPQGAAAPASSAAPADPDGAPDDRIEIVLPDGTARCGSPRRSAPRPCAACWQRCADDPDTCRGARLACGRPHGYAARHALIGPAGAAGTRPRSALRRSLRVPWPPCRPGQDHLARRCRHVSLCEEVGKGTFHLLWPLSTALGTRRRSPTTGTALPVCTRSAWVRTPGVLDGRSGSYAGVGYPMMTVRRRAASLWPRTWASPPVQHEFEDPLYRARRPR